MENKSEAEDVEMVGVLALDTNAAAETRKVEVGGSNNLMDSINSSLWRNSVAASTTAEGDPETPTSATPTTTTGSIVAMSMLNERMAVLAQAEELEENRKPRPDSANPVRSRSQPFLEENKRQSGAAGFVKGGAPTAVDLSHTKAPEPTRTWSLSSQSSFNRANASSEAGRGPVAPPPRLPFPDDRPPERRRMAPPPLSVMLEDGEPETEEIMMLSEEEAKTISAGGGVNKSNNWREERTVAGLLLADEERSKEEATRASMQSSDIVSFTQDEANADEGDGAAVVSLRQQYRRSSSNTTSGSGGAGSHDGATDEVLLI
uniref:Uncharacterized protein n=1 Tax=Tetraselmis chuii TaxID=63592 RepID=A0A7S1STW4_9CHLO